MWALAVVLGAGLALLVRWRRSRLTWKDFVILHGTRVYCRLWHRWTCRWLAPLPRHGPALIIANHTCSADPNFIMAGSPRLLSFLVAREHFDLHPRTRAFLDYLQCVPVTRNGPDPVALRLALRRLAAGRAVCVFPEGNLSGVKRNRLLPAKPGVAYLALRARAPVHPVFIMGGPRTERLLASWLWPSPKAVRVIFGPPVDLSAYHDKPLSRPIIEEVTTLLMERVEALPSLLRETRTLRKP
jgi:1-acyl-sn-glycerol-3-phosphate acyltransferase